MGLISDKTKHQKINVTLIGPSQAGKTTFIHFLETGKEVTEELPSTLGISIRKDFYDLEGWLFNALDTGGETIYQQTYWEMAIERADVVLFVLDAIITMDKDQTQFELMLKQLEYAVDIIPRDVPFAILANKQDLKHEHPLKKDQIKSLIKPGLFENRVFEIFETSGKYGTNVDNVIDWVIRTQQ